MINYIIIIFNLTNTQADTLKKNIIKKIYIYLDVKTIGKMRDLEKELVIFVMQK